MIDDRVRKLLEEIRELDAQRGFKRKSFREVWNKKREDETFEEAWDDMMKKMERNGEWREKNYRRRLMHDG